MKKIIALVLTLALCLACTAAFATEMQQAEITVDAPAGNTIGFADLGISLIIPEALVQTEVSAENAAAGIFDYYVTANETATFMLGANQLTEGGIEAMMTAVQADAKYKDVGLVTINSIPFFTFVDTELNQEIFVTDMGEILFSAYASPADDSDYMAVVAQILGSMAQLAE